MAVPTTSTRQRLTRADCLAALAILTQVIWRGAIAAGAVSRQDDFLLASQAHRSGLSGVFDDYHGHVQVIGWLVAWLADRMAPLQHWPLALIIVVMQATASGLGWLAIRKLVGPRLPAVLGLAVLLFSPLTIGPLVWASAAVQALTLQIAIFGAIIVHQRAVERGTTNAVVLAWLVVAVGLLANEKALVVPLLLLCLGAISSWPSLRNSLRVDRTLWAGYGALIAGELVLYMSVSRSDHFQPLGRIGVLASDGLARTWLPQITAVPIRGAIWAPLIKPPPVAATVLASLLVVVVLIVAATRTGFRAARAAALLATYVVAEYAVIAVSRLGFGDIIAIDTRYIADTVPVTAICLALALTRRQDDRAWRIGRVTPGRSREIRPLIAATLAITAYGVCAVPVTAATAKAGQEAGNQTYVDRLRHELSGQNLTLVDGPVPGNVIADLFGSQARLSELTSVLPGRRSFAGVTPTPYMVDATGALRRAAPGPESKDIQGPEAGCGWSVLSDAETDIAVPDSLNGQPGILSIGYVLGAPTPVAIVVAGKRTSLNLPQGLGHINVVVNAGAGPIVASGVTSGVRLCISDVRVGPAAPE